LASSHPFPIDLIFIRHGESEGDLANRMAKAGELMWTEEFKKRHSSKYRLTTKGVQQAKTAGKWLKENVATTFDAYYCSEYVRAMETAAHLQIPHSLWYTEFFLREQDQGVLAGRPTKDNEELYANELQRRSRDIFYYQPPGGESIANLALRVDRWLSTVRAQFSGCRVVTVCHGTTLKAARLRIERLKQEEWHKLDHDPYLIANNCQIVHYSRRNPEDGSVHRELEWVRSVCPWDLTLTPTNWRRLQFVNFSGPELLRFVEMAPRIIDNDPNESPDLGSD